MAQTRRKHSPEYDFVFVGHIVVSELSGGEVGVDAVLVRDG